MKKIILNLVTAIILAGCSSNPETLKATNDSFQKSETSIPHFSPLATGGVQLPKADDAYSLPNIEVKKRGDIDIRPPLIPLAIIQNSITKFDGERSLIVYPKQQAKLYNLQQVERLLKEEGISSTTDGSILTTDWAKTERIGDKSIEIKISNRTSYDS
ncbi:lipoprotein [Haemophilus influenzae]|uniref:Lipoprotein n=1 Tax=Haemophilus influenzae TaxID=727 RepID=A0A2X1Q0A6_HAEIF|nr:lipoprotein [Haemophilus influenzae]